MGPTLLPRALLIAAVVLVAGGVSALVLSRAPGRVTSTGASSPWRASPARAGVGAPPAPFDVAVEDDASPWSNPDGSGYANDVVRAAFRAAGADVRLQVVPYARCKEQVMDGQIVACFSMSRLPALERKLEFSAAPLFVCDSWLVQAARARAIERASDLASGTIVGIVLGYEYPAALYELERAGTLVFEPSASEEINLKKLADGRIAAAVLNGNAIKTVAGLADKAGVAGKVKVAFRLGELPSYIGFSRTHARGAEARARFDAGMRTLVADGTLARITADWASRAARAGAP